MNSTFHNVFFTSEYWILDNRKQDPINDTSIKEYNARVDKYGKHRLIPILSVNVQTYQIYYSLSIPNPE